MSRKREGQAVWVDATARAPGHYAVRVTVGRGTDVERPWFDCNASPRSPQAEARAKETALAWAERETAKGNSYVEPRRGSARAKAEPVAAPTAEGETVGAYAVRWFSDRQRRGLSSVDNDRSRFKTWAEPTLGSLVVVDVTTADVERLVEALDAAVQGEELAWKTAQNVWGLVSKLFDDAAHAKTLALRVRPKSNPAAGVRGPDKGDEVSKVYLYPSDLSALVSSDETPVDFARVVVLAVYALLRSAELRGLCWEDVDVERRQIHVHRTVDKHGKEGSTKGGRARRVPIEAELVPMLAAMKRESGGTGYVFPDYPSESHLAKALRGYLTRAGVDRAELHKPTRTRRQLRFHDTKGTGTTWRVIRGDDPLKIMADAAHRHFGTTQAYIREARAVAQGFGDVFPKLPARLTTPNKGRRFGSGAPKSAEGLCEEGDLNPHESYPTGT